MDNATKPVRFPRLARWFVGLGSVVLAGSLISAGAVNSNKTGNDKTDDASPNRVIQFGYVDAAHGGVRSLAPSMAGRVTWAIAESEEEVAEGTELVKFDAVGAEAALRAADADLQGAKVSLEGAKQKAVQYASQVEEQTQAVKAAEDQYEAAKIRYERAKVSEEKHLIKPEELQAISKDLDALGSKVNAEKWKLTGLKAIDAQLLVQRADQEVAAKQAQRDRADKVVQEHTLKAPMKGRVLRVMVNSGDMFSPELKSPALLFAPAGDLIVRVEIEQEFANRVKKGERVCIQDDTNGQGRWTGAVSYIANWYAPRRNILPEPVQSHDVRTLECIVENIKPIAGVADMPLRINQRMRVSIYPPGTEPGDCKGD